MARRLKSGANLLKLVLGPVAEPLQADVQFDEEVPGGPRCGPQLGSYPVAAPNCGVAGSGPLWRPSVPTALSGLRQFLTGSACVTGPSAAYCL